VVAIRTRQSRSTLRFRRQSLSLALGNNILSLDERRHVNADNATMKFQPTLLITVGLAVFAVQRTAAAATCSGDDFNDNLKDVRRWGEDITDPGSPSQVQEMDGRLQFTGTSFAFRPWICSYGSYLQDWEVVTDVHLGDVLLTQNESHVEVILAVFNNAAHRF
jgi:hypothetical protein